MKTYDNSAISLKRLQTLTDVIFAVCMLGLLLLIEKPPQDIKSTEVAIQKYLFGQFDVITAYLVTYINIAFYWFFSHNESKYLKRSNGVHVWLTILTLMTVGLLPFANSLSVVFPSSMTVQLFYSSIVFFVGLLFCADWVYATRKDRLVDRSIDSDIVENLIVESLVQPVAALLSLAGAFWGYIWWQLPFLLVPVAEITLNRLWARRRAGRQAAQH
jgi:uncharacterized membrane protein